MLFDKFSSAVFKEGIYIDILLMGTAGIDILQVISVTIKGRFFKTRDFYLIRTTEARVCITWTGQVPPTDGGKKKH